MRISRRTRFRGREGQALVLMVLFLTVLLAMSAAVLDAGAWYRAQRHLQATVDAAALAGAQALPDDAALARSLADEYVAKNGGADSVVSFKSGLTGSDTVTVTATRQAPGIFAKVLGIQTVRVRATAAARSGAPEEVRWAAPIAVDEKHPMLQCKPLPCFGEPTALDLKKTGPGAFRLVNLDGSRGGIGPPTLADWIERGFDGWMPLGWYYSDPGAKFNSSQVQEALDERLETELLFPVYRSTRGQGANFEYDVVGWAGFYLTGFEARGSSGLLYGAFSRVIWEGIQNESAEAADFGVRAVSLVE